MNMWIAKGKRLTAEDLLGADFMRELGVAKFKSKAEWDAHKVDLQKMARWHSHILRQTKTGKRKIKRTATYEQMLKDKRGK